jgi:hypothetical protein
LPCPGTRLLPDSAGDGVLAISHLLVDTGLTRVMSRRKCASVTWSLLQMNRWSWQAM